MTFKKAYLGIGTNKGNKEENISSAIKTIKTIKEIKIVKISHLFKNPPQEGIKGEDFLNGAIEIQTCLTPSELLRTCKSIEEILGRKIIKNEKVKKSRIIDLDILFYENEILDFKDLNIPHKKICIRDFVLVPLLEIAPDFIHPIFNKSIKDLYLEFSKKQLLDSIC